MAVTGADKPRTYAGDYMQEGRVAEAVCMEFIRQCPSVLHLEDARGLRVSREADMDCVVYLRDGTLALAEIKSDRHIGVSGNVLFEVLRINHTCIQERSCVLGWSARSPAHWLLFYSPSLQTIYICRFSDLRSRFQQYTRKARQQTRVVWVCTDAIKSTINVLLPWSACSDIFRVYDVSGIVKRHEGLCS